MDTGQNKILLELNNVLPQLHIKIRYYILASLENVYCPINCTRKIECSTICLQSNVYLEMSRVNTIWQVPKHLIRFNLFQIEV